MRILILMSDTGGGHRASAQSLLLGFERRYGGRFEIEIVDLLVDYLPWPLRRLPHSYAFLSGQATVLWKFLWRVGERRRLASALARVAAAWAYADLRRLLDAKQPDLLLSVHPLAQDLVLYTLARLGRSIPFVTVVTDLTTAHPLWFHPAVDLCFVASDEAYGRGLRCGLRPEQLRQYGLPVRPAFAEPLAPQSELRCKLGLPLHLPIVLLVGGGEGIGPLAETAEALASALQARSVQGGIAVICGRNRELQQALEARRWPVPVTVRGFVGNMYDWMAACDCIVTKAGPGTISEALICGLPIVLNGFIPGQEEGNVAYVVEHGVGIFCARPQEVADVVCRWFGSGSAERTAMAERARALGNPQATDEIVKEIGSLLM